MPAVPPTRSSRLAFAPWRNYALALLCASVVTVLLVFYVDEPLNRSIRAGLDSHVYEFFRDFTKAGLAGHWYAFFGLAWLICRTSSQRAATPERRALWAARTRSWLFGLCAMGAGSIVVHVVKFVAGRHRPRLLFSEDIYSFEPFSGHNSFPSGHSQIVWSVAAALWILYPRYRLIYVACAVVFSLSRVVVIAHYLSDTVMGAALAILAALLVRDWFERDGKPVRLR